MKVKKFKNYSISEKIQKISNLKTLNMSINLKTKTDNENEINVSVKRQKTDVDQIEKLDSTNENAGQDENGEYVEDDEDNLITHSENVGIKERINKGFSRFKGLIKQM